MTMRFRERDGVCIEYEVRGIPGSERYPYLNHIPTLKEAVAIAHTYPGVYGDGAATHVIRRYSKKYPEGHEFHHTSHLTHRWRVDSEGRIQLIVYYRRAVRGETLRRQSSQDYIAALPEMPNRATTLRGELVDLAAIAERIGLHDASRALRNHAYGRQRLPDFGASIKEPVEPMNGQGGNGHTSWWRRIMTRRPTMKPTDLHTTTEHSFAPAVDLMLVGAPAALFRAIAEAHDFNLGQLTPAEANRLSGFLDVADQQRYQACAGWPEKVFLSAKLTCQTELHRAMQAHEARALAENRQ